MGSYLSRYLSRYRAGRLAEARVRRPRPAWQRLCPGSLPPPRAKPARHSRLQPRDLGPGLRLRPPGRDSARGPGASGPQARRRGWPGRPPLRPSTGLRLCSPRRALLKGFMWTTRTPCRVGRTVTIHVAPPLRRGSFYRYPPRQERPDPCARETVLQALRRCQKGKRRFDGPLWFETPEPKRRGQSPAPRPSAFQPVRRNAAAPAFVPRPGPLTSSLCSRGDCL